MGKSFILKRRSYADDTSFDFINGVQVKNAKGIGGMAKNAALSTATSPLMVGGAILENASSKMQDAVNDVKDTAETYTPTVQNAFVQPKNYSEPSQKSYGFVQAAKEIGTGVGKGLLNYAKKNKGTAASMAGFGAVMAGGTYGMNRIQRQKAENEAGTRTTDGMSTGGKVVSGLTAAGAGAYAAHTGAKSWDKAMNAAKDVAGGKTTLQGGDVKYDTKKHGEFFKGLTSTAKDGTKTTTTSVQRAQDKISKLNKGKLGMSGKMTRMAGRGLLAAGAVAGAGLLANSMLKQPKKQESTYSDIEQREYAGFVAMGKRVFKSVYDKALKGNANAGIGDKAIAGAKALGAGISAGTRKLGRSASDFMSMGSNGARDAVREIGKGLRESGEYGKKAADFLQKHKTGAMITGAATVGTGGFALANAAGEKPVELASKLDKKTDKFVKDQQNQYQKTYQSPQY